ncbi:MAG TPA: hypothetical protein VMU67_10700 [Steroidobacteraceae bacterium]|nr:hypothetical protein [Steroidobacteraceae bacterium]
MKSSRLLIAALAHAGLALLLCVSPPLGVAAGTVEPRMTSLYADPAQPDISGLWLVTGWFQFSPDKALPQLKPPYDALYAKRMKAFSAGKPIDDVTANCLPPGMPHIMVVPYPFELVQTPGRVLMLFEYAGQVRRIYLDGRRPSADDDPTYYGFSTGHWNGAMLEVDTSLIRADTQVDFTGLPHSDALVITERFRRIDHDTLQDVITLTDPKAYVRPFTVTRRYRLHPTWTIGEYVCEENNRNQSRSNGVTGFGVPPPEDP